MNRNIGNADRQLRFSFAALFGTLYITGIVTGVPGLLLAILGGLLLLTGLFSTCPLYVLFGKNTRTIE